MENVARDLDKVGKKLQKTGQNLSRNVTAPIAALGLVATATFASFEQELAKVQAISGATGAEFQALKKDAEDLGAATRFTASEVAGLQLNFSKLGFSPDEILAATGATLNLAQATGEDLAQSATVAASTIKGFQLTASETERVTDVMAKAFSSSALDLEKFSTAMSTVAPVANTAKQSIEDTTGFLSVLVNAGIDASTAGTGLRNIFLDVAKSGKTLEGALGEISSSTNQNATAMQLFGKRGATVATVLANNIDQAKGFAEEFRNAGGSAASMAAIMDNTLSGSLARLKSATEGAAIAFGEVMAPAVRSVVDTVSSLVSNFRELSPQTKQFIVIAGGIAAAVGPAVIVIGTLLRNLSAIIPVLRTLTIAIAANPLGALAVVIGAAAGAALVATSRFSALTDAQAEYADVTVTASQNIAKEKAQLDRLLSVARNESVSKKQRQEAIRELNRLSPEYLKNLSLENINTDAARKATDEYVQSLLLKAKVIAAEDKLVEVQKQLLDLQLGQNDAVKPSIWQNLGNAILSAGSAQKIVARTALTVAENLSEEEKQLVSLQEKLTDFLTVNDQVASRSTPTVTPTVLPPAGPAGGGSTQDDLDLADELEFSSMEELNQALIDTGANLDLAISEASVAAFEARMQNIVDAYGSTNDGIDEEVIRFDESAQKMQAIAQTVSGALSNAFSTLGQNIAQGLGVAEGGFRAFIGTLVQTATQLIGILLSQSIATSIAGATASGAATGPAAVFTTPGFIATAVSGVLAAFAAIPQFETGGIVGGSSYTGDRILARVNSGELILNQAQQDSLYSQLDRSSSMEITGQLRARGNDLIAVLNRQQERNRSIGGNG